MMFTDRYIKVPIRLVDTKLEEMTNGKDNNFQDSYMMLDPYCITMYHPTEDKNDIDFGEVTMVKDKTGGTVIVYLPVKKFEELLNKTRIISTN